jgi:hypothetical protein
LSLNLTWRDAERDDRAALEQFTCTVAPERLPNGRRLPHPRPWELEAQTGIRQHTPPGSSDDLYRIGVNNNGSIVAVSITGLLEDPDFEPTFKLLVLAIAMPARRQGGDVANACMIDALHQMELRVQAVGALQFLVLAMIDPRNSASKWMCQRHAFAHIGEEGEYELWGRLVAVTAPA